MLLISWCTGSFLGGSGLICLGGNLCFHCSRTPARTMFGPKQRSMGGSPMRKTTGLAQLLHGWGVTIR